MQPIVMPAVIAFATLSIRTSMSTGFRQPPWHSCGVCLTARDGGLNPRPCTNAPPVLYAGQRKEARMPDSADTFDYIVTGAGSAGSAVAARLSESGRHRVLLLEAGGKDRNRWIHIPMGFTRLFADPSVNWMYESEPEPELGGRSMYQPRGKVLGGMSSINGMVYMRGNAADYDEWRQRGCTGWDY